VIRIPAVLVDALQAAARSGYPEEVCGVLLGRDADGARAIVRVTPVANERSDERQRRYLIPPDALLRIERESAQEGLDVVGFYHSHPDHSALPSDYDRTHAWPWYSYVIVPVDDGEPGAPRSWRLTEDRERFVEEVIDEESDGRGRSTGP
jgi:proteasome lid subunit RPN8/RPN11